GQKPQYLDVFSHLVDTRYRDLYLALQQGSSAREIWNRWRIAKVREVLGVADDRVSIMNHEHAHAAYAFYGSPFRTEDTLIVKFDGFGDEANASIAECANGRIQ